MRAGFSRIDNRLNSNSPTPRLNFPSAILGSPTNSPQWWKEMNTQINQSIAYFLPDLKGEHNMKGGLQIFLPRFWGAFPQPAYGSYNFSRDPADFNDPSTYPRADVVHDPAGRHLIQGEQSDLRGVLPGQLDDRPALTLNLGLRYDLETGTTNKDREHPAEPGERGNDVDNFAPRFGFTYDLTGTGRSILRGGYGLYYDKVMLNLTSNERRVIEGQIITVTVANPVFGNPLGGLTYEDYKARNIPATTIVIAQDYQTPVNEQVSLGLAQQVGQRYGFQADFVYSNGRDEPMVVDANFLQDPVTGLPLNPTISGYRDPRYTRIQRTQSTGKSEYTALQTGFNARPVGQGWLNQIQFQGSYTLSKTKDNHTSNRGGTPTNPFNLDAEWSDSQQDQRHRFTTNVIVPLPYDIRLSAIYFLGSERVINVATTLDPFRLGYTARWLNDAGDILARNSERTEKWDKKLDLRLSKTLAREPDVVRGHRGRLQRPQYLEPDQLRHQLLRRDVPAAGELDEHLLPAAPGAVRFPGHVLRHAGRSSTNEAGRQPPCPALDYDVLAGACWCCLRPRAVARDHGTAYPGRARTVARRPLIRTSSRCHPLRATPRGV